VRQISGKEFARVLERRGWELRRIGGSHHVYIKPGRIERISLPVHGSKPLKMGLLKHLMKIAEIQESEL
jgi:predicted RNA binding protein YcfA (HicA-like mRNA interferase family)